MTVRNIITSCTYCPGCAGAAKTPILIRVFQHVSAWYYYSNICPWPEESAAGAQHSPSRPSFPKIIWLNQFSLWCTFCLAISLQSFTAWPEAIPSSPGVSLLHLQDTEFPSVPVLQSEPPFLHIPQTGNFNSLFIHFYQKTSCSQGICFFLLSPKVSLDCDWTPKKVTQEGWGLSIFGDIQNLTGHGPKQPAFGEPALHSRLDRQSPEVPSRLTHSVSASRNLYALSPASSVWQSSPLLWLLPCWRHTARSVALPLTCQMVKMTSSGIFWH